MNEKMIRHKPMTYHVGMFCVWLAAVIASILAVWFISDWFALTHEITAFILVTAFSCITITIFLLHYRRQR